MLFKKRWLKILTVLLAVVSFVGYFTFSTLLFPPHEGRWGFDVASLIPRDVDFFAAKADLSGDFDGFPRLAVLDEVEGTEAWKTFSRSTERDELDREYGVTEALDAIRVQLEALPFGIEPLGLFGGSDLALAGRFSGTRIEDASWACYGRMNWMGKLGISLLAFPGVISLESQGLLAEDLDGVFRLSGGQLAKPVWVVRHMDIGILGNSEELVRAAVDLASRRGEGSLYASSDYGDDIDLATRSEERDEVEMIFDVRSLLSSLGHSGPLPDPNASNFLTAFLGRIFQVPACKKVIGTLGFQGGAVLDLHGTFSSENITEVQRRVYGAPGFGHEDVLNDIATHVPDDSVAFVYLTGPIDVLLKQVMGSLEPAMYSNLQDAFRQTGRYNSLDELIDEVSAGLRNRLLLVVRENDYPAEMGQNPDTGELVDVGPPNDGAPVFAVCLVTWYSDEGKLLQVQNAIGENPKIFGLEGLNGENGYYTNRTLGGLVTREFWSRFIPGTGHVATVRRPEHFYVTNHLKMLDQLIGTHTSGGRSYPSLANRMDFKDLVRSTHPSSNLLVWIDPRAAASTLEAQARQQARNDAASSIDWVKIRREEDLKAMSRMFPGKRPAQLSEEERSQLNVEVDGILRARREQLIGGSVPERFEELRRSITYYGSVESLLLSLSLDQRDFRLALRASVPLD